MAHNMDRPSLPPTETLIAFRLVRDHGSYAAAARAEGVNHATILRRVATLEMWLGTRLFERAGRGIVLTPAGQRFARLADNVVDMMEGAADRWRPAVAPMRIVLSVLPAFARLHLMPILPRLLQPKGRGPRRRLEISVSHGPVPLGDGQCDVAVRYGVGRWEDVCARPLPEEALYAVVHRNLLERERLEPEMIARMPLIHNSDAADWRRWFADNGIPYRLKASDLRFEDYDLALDAARRGLGALLLRSPDGSVPAPFVALTDAPLPNLRRHWVVTAKNEERRGALAFADTLRGLLAEQCLGRLEKADVRRPRDMM